MEPSVSDSGATNKVAGKIWFSCYVNSLNSEEKSRIQHHVATNVYRSGDGNLVQAVENVDLPIAMGSKHVMFKTDIALSDIPNPSLWKVHEKSRHANRL